MQLLPPWVSAVGVCVCGVCVWFVNEPNSERSEEMMIESGTIHHHPSHTPLLPDTRPSFGTLATHTQQLTL